MIKYGPLICGPEWAAGINSSFQQSAGQKVHIYVITEMGDLGHGMGGGDGQLRFGRCFAIGETRGVGLNNGAMRKRLRYDIYVI